ncbi:hypothetical protein NUW46_14980 [Marinobacter sp. MA]|uniref:hypothetical protein n=1 Tax=Marinobacter sp. MA TaxID=2971606 RepID=UPI003AB0FE9A
MHHAFKSSILSIMFLIAACSQAPEPPEVADRVSIEYVNPDVGNPSSACACDQSREVYLRNSDTVNRRYVLTEVTVLVPSQNGDNEFTELDKFVRDDNLAKAPSSTEKSELFLGCTIETIGEPAACLKKNEFRKKRESVMRTAASLGSELALPGPYFTNDPLTCITLCDAGVSCLTYGESGAALAKPFLALLEAAKNNPGTKIPKEQILKSYNLSAEDDNCERSDIFVTEESVENYSLNDSLKRSGSKCNISVGKITSSAVLSTTNLSLPHEVVATYEGPEHHPFLDKNYLSLPLLNFKDADQAPKIYFDGRGGKDLTNLFGGRILYATDYRNKIYLSNSNGCMRIDKINER